MIEASKYIFLYLSFLLCTNMFTLCAGQEPDNASELNAPETHEDFTNGHLHLETDEQDENIPTQQSDVRIINEIIISGNRYTSEEAIRSYFTCKPKETVKMQKINN